MLKSERIKQYFSQVLYLKTRRNCTKAKSRPLQFHFQRTIFRLFYWENKIQKVENSRNTFKTEKVVQKLLFLFVAVSATTFLALMGRYLMSFSFFTTWHTTFFF